MPSPAIRLLVVTFIALLQFICLCAASTLPLPIVDAPSADGGSVALDPIRQRAQPTRRLVYSCVTPGHVTFADRPCGPESGVRELKVAAPAAAAAGAAPNVAKARLAPPAGKRQAPALPAAGENAAVDEHATTCRKLQTTLDDVDARMRAGYSAREAGRLWERWREAKAHLHAARC